MNDISETGFRHALMESETMTTSDRFFAESISSKENKPNEVTIDK